MGQKQAALQALHDLITSKRYRAWQKTLEKIMFKYVELCVDMRKGRFAKDGLIQYRIVCQQVNVSSLEEVIKHFMHLSTERAEQVIVILHCLEVHNIYFIGISDCGNVVMEHHKSTQFLL